MLKDDEVNVVILDEKVTKELNDHFEDDLNHCIKVEKGSWKKRSLIRRIKEKLSLLFTRQI
jgi:phosphatidylserine/phosphatidylglycerophosphate/cardiolipin synthase-like enzyme